MVLFNGKTRRRSEFTVGREITIRNIIQSARAAQSQEEFIARINQGAAAFGIRNEEILNRLSNQVKVKFGVK